MCPIDLWRWNFGVRNPNLAFARIRFCGHSLLFITGVNHCVDNPSRSSGNQKALYSQGALPHLSPSYWGITLVYGRGSVEPVRNSACRFYSYTVRSHQNVSDIKRRPSEVDPESLWNFPSCYGLRSRLYKPRGSIARDVRSQPTRPEGRC